MFMVSILKHVILNISWCTFLISKIVLVCIIKPELNNALKLSFIMHNYLLGVRCNPTYSWRLYFAFYMEYIGWRGLFFATMPYSDPVVITTVIQRLVCGENYSRYRGSRDKFLHSNKIWFREVSLQVRVRTQLWL